MMDRPGPEWVPVILTGGIGSRLWPFSREQMPKPFIPLLERSSLLQNTLLRCADITEMGPPILVAAEQHRFIIAEQLEQARITPEAVLLEPMARGTAAAAAAAALAALRSHAAPLLVVMPSDHIVANTPAFAEALRRAADHAGDDRLAVLANRPESPHPGYGYIHLAEPADADRPVRYADRFIEKPPIEHAERLLADGGWWWNCGILVGSARAVLAAFERHLPTVLNAAEAALANGRGTAPYLSLDGRSFQAAPQISLDHGVLEHAQGLLAVPVDMGWSDAGAWSHIWSVSPKDDRGNAISGRVTMINSRDCLVRSDGPLVGCAYIEDMIVVASVDAVLVAPRSKADEVKALVGELTRRGASEASEHPRVRRPWGEYASVYKGDRFQVKTIVVKPGGRLSSQRHLHRAEHWVVVQGAALVTCGDEVTILRENQSTMIPAGALHRLENPGKIPLCLIEVQSGPYLGEDDIVRYDDCYGRTVAEDKGADRALSL